MAETALYNRDHPNGYIASGNTYESDKQKVCLFHHPHYTKFPVNFPSNMNQSTVNASTSSTFIPTSLLAQAQKCITTLMSKESGNRNKNNNPTPVLRYDQDWKKSGPPPRITESTWQSFNTIPEKEDPCSSVNFGIIVWYLNGEINYLDFTDKNHNVKNSRYQIIGAYSSAVLGEDLFDPWLLRLAKIVQQLWRIEEYASDAIFLHLASAKSVQQLVQLVNP